MTENLEAARLDAWRGVLFSHAKVLRALEADMLEQHDLRITLFDVLSRLKGAPDHRLRMSELEEASLFTRSGITALADRLEKVGLVQRERSTEDRRGVYLALTESGLEKFNAVWADHQKSIQEHFGRHIDAEDAAAVTAAMSKILHTDD